jgi:glucose/arabinose dehydrogenase
MSTQAGNCALRRRPLQGLALLCLLIVTMLPLEPAAGEMRGSGAVPLTLDLALENFASGFSAPTDIVNAGDSRLFVTELSGLIRIVQADGTVLPTPFLDLRDKVIREVSELGLMGLVFTPGDPTTFYVHYVNGGQQSIIARYRTANDTLDQADPGSEQVILTINTEGGTHVGGALVFGPDGYLYIPYGTGPGGGGSNTHGQDLSTWLGTVLRIDVTGQTTYTIPPGNPFTDDGDPNTLPEIWSYGWRNPWKLSFDRNTGAMFVADVGQNVWEEISYEPPNTPGRNYGWQICEGSYLYPPRTDGPRCPTDLYVPPIFEYRHGARCAVIGGFVYRGALYPNLMGRYLLADFCAGTIWTLTPDGSGGWSATDHGTLSARTPSTFGEDAAGELYVADYGSGRIYRVVDRFQASLVHKHFLPLIGKGDP